MSKRKVVVIGIDGMDYELTCQFLPNLPNIKKLSESGLFCPFSSVFPPDSIPAWVTCFTGKDPSEHGILASIDYLSKKKISVDTSQFRGKTFWDIIGKSGYRVCVINPFLAYPVWDVNGIMISGPVFISGEVQSYNSLRINIDNIPKSFGGIVDFPKKKNLAEFAEKAYKDTLEQAEFGLHLFQKSHFDLFFQTFLTLDRIQHFFWRYCDKDDPTYPGSNSFENVIFKFYKLFDEIIGRFLQLLKPEDILIVISDHGHGRRCIYCFNVNEYLRRKGFLKTKGGIKSLFIEKMKNNFLYIMDKFGLDDHISTVAKLVPRAKKIKKGEHIVGHNDSLAYLADFGSVNSFGGIFINKDLVNDYDQTREILVKNLNNFQYNGRALFRWIKFREQLYNGPYSYKYPDIVFTLDYDFGINWSTYTKLITINYTHKKISGGHRETGVWISTIFSNRKSLIEMSIEEFFLIILAIFGINYKY